MSTALREMDGLALSSDGEVGCTVDVVVVMEGSTTGDAGELAEDVEDRGFMSRPALGAGNGSPLGVDADEFSEAFEVDVGRAIGGIPVR